MAMREPAPAVSESDLSRLGDLVQARTGMALSPSRTPNLERAVRLTMAEARAEDPGTLYDLLSDQAHPAEARSPQGGVALETLIAALNVGETHFFRDQRQMQALEQRILPGLIAARRRERRLRIWSAGCSTGEEAYTLAILVDRVLPDRASWDVLILGTDINGEALERARQASYGLWSLRGCSELAHSPYLIQQDGRFHVAADIRAMVSFAPLNLVEEGYPSPSTNTHAMDVVVCRNVLLYFDRQVARSVVRRMGDALVEGGYLLVSQVEAGIPIFEGLDYEPQGCAVYRKSGNQLAGSIGPGEAETRPAGPAARRSPAQAATDKELLRSLAGRRPGNEPLGSGSHRAHRSDSPAPIVRLTTPGPAPGAVAGAGPSPYETALGLWQLEQQEEALRFLEAEAGRDPLAPALHYLQGLLLLDMARPDEALAAFRRCTCADPAFVAGHLAQAGLFARAGLEDRARAALRNTVKLVAGREPEDLVLERDGLTVGDVLDLVTAQRGLLTHDREPEAGHA